MPKFTQHVDGLVYAPGFGVQTTGQHAANVEAMNAMHGARGRSRKGFYVALPKGL